MTPQPKLPGLEAYKPPRPTIQHEPIARAIAERIVREVNLDEFYWTAAELPDRVWDVQHEIMRGIHPVDVFAALWVQQPFVSCERRERVTAPYGWEGIDEHCRAIADDIAAEELSAAVNHWNQQHGSHA